MNSILEYLNKDFLLNVDIIDTINRNFYDEIYSTENGVLVKNSVGVYMISATTPTCATYLIDKIPTDSSLVVGHQYFYYHKLKERVNPVSEFHCYQSVYIPVKTIDIPNSVATILPLNSSFANEVFSKYSNSCIINLDYIVDRLNSGTMLGAFIDNKLIGFVGTHAEGSIGILEVLPEYRGLGIASTLQAHATNLALSENRIPYGQVKEENNISINLQKKLGFTLSENKIYWLEK